MLFPLIKEILSFPPDSRELKVRGWVRTKRELKNLVFVELNDGSSLRGIQCTFDRNLPGKAGRAEGPSEELVGDPAAALAVLGTGDAVEIGGRLVPSPASGQPAELAASSLRITGPAPAEGRPGIAPYPLQKKRHSLEFLREIAHLRPRTNTFAALTRLRSRLAFGIHQ
jgi:asparaginyl-tRNA synthetase